MKITRIERNGVVCAAVESDGQVITDVESALELLMNAQYGAGTKNIAIAKEQVCTDFFLLGTGIAGEILQKIVDYGGRIALYGDFACYASKPLRDFMRESNRGTRIFFVSTREEAIDRLTSVGADKCASTKGATAGGDL